MQVTLDAIPKDKIRTDDELFNDKRTTKRYERLESFNCAPLRSSLVSPQRCCNFSRAKLVEPDGKLSSLGKWFTPFFNLLQLIS